MDGAARTGGMDAYNANMYAEDPSADTTYGVEAYGATDAYGYGSAPRRGGMPQKRGGRGGSAGAQPLPPDATGTEDSVALAPRVARAPAAQPDNLQLDPEEKAAILRARARRAQMLASSSVYDNELKTVDTYSGVDPYNSAMRRPNDYNATADAQYAHHI